MPAIQELCFIYGVNPKKFSRNENLLLEADLFVRICEELKKIYRDNYKDFFRLMKFTKEMENEMIETNLLPCVINDILSTEEYTLHGIAFYSGTSEDVIHEVMIGLNTSPSLLLARRIIELHRSIRPNLYRELMNKIANEREIAA